MLFLFFMNPASSHSDPEIKCHSGGVPFHCHGTGTVSYLPDYPQYAEAEEDIGNLKEDLNIGAWKQYHDEDKSEYTAVS